MALLDDCKTPLRISLSNTAFDDEITDLISAAQQDLILSGVLSTMVTVVTDPLIKRAITVYCKANFGFDNPDAERLQQSYESIKTSLVLSTDYTGDIPITPDDPDATMDLLDDDPYDTSLTAGVDYVL